MSDFKKMLLVTSNWNDSKSFRLLPLTMDAPYSEGIYDPRSKVLVLMSTLKKESFHMMPRLDDNGDPMAAKGVKRLSGKEYKEQRQIVETFTEFYVTEKSEITNLINLIAVNNDIFDFAQYLAEPTLIQVEKPKVELIK